MTANYLTVRNVPAALAAALEQEKRRRGTSLNQTVIDLLSQSLGVTRNRSNGLARLAGTWSEADHKEFLSAMTPFGQIDADLWK